MWLKYASCNCSLVVLAENSWGLCRFDMRDVRQQRLSRAVLAVHALPTYHIEYTLDSLKRSVHYDATGTLPDPM